MPEREAVTRPWLTGAVPDLRDGACQVWWAPRIALRSRLVEMLDTVERHRLAGFLHDADRERFTLGCVIARSVLAAHLSIAPADVILDRRCTDCGRPHGKVRLVTDGDRIEMSVSHSADRIAVAFHRGAPVGVDVERVDPGLDAAELSEHALTELESARLRELDGADRARGFTTYWTRKEAVLKATGEGLRVPLSEVSVSGPGEPPQLLARSGQPKLPTALRLYDLDPGDGYVAALAVLGDRPVDVCQLDARHWLAQPLAVR